MFVEELFSAYQKYSQKNKLKTEILHSDNGHIIANVRGEGAGQAFAHEAGQHCVQRIPDTESKGKKHTSLISVGILPIRQQEGDEPLKDSDLEIIYQTGKQGAGGQNVNKVCSAVRMKHLPTGMSVFINGRDQHKNKDEARKILTQRVNDQKRAERDASYAAFRKAQMGDGSRGEKIRTYNLMEKRIVDHRLGTKTNNVKAVMRGDFELLIGENH